MHTLLIYILIYTYLRFAADGSLLLFNVSPGDGGVYQCVASNGRERRTASTVFSVISHSQNTRQTTTTTQRPDRGFSGHTGHSGRQEEERSYDTDLSYDVSGSHIGDQFVVVSIQEAQETVDQALNHTVNLLFQHSAHTNRTPSELLNIFRYIKKSYF